jgi:hypothetical protein
MSVAPPLTLQFSHYRIVEKLGGGGMRFNDNTIARGSGQRNREVHRRCELHREHCSPRRDAEVFGSARSQTSNVPDVSVLSFSFETDQSFLAHTVRELKTIVSRFPVRSS